VGLNSRWNLSSKGRWRWDYGPAVWEAMLRSTFRRILMPPYSWHGGSTYFWTSLSIYRARHVPDHTLTEKRLTLISKTTVPFDPKYEATLLPKQPQRKQCWPTKEALSRLPIIRHGHVISYYTLNNKACSQVLPCSCLRITTLYS